MRVEGEGGIFYFLFSWEGAEDKRVSEESCWWGAEKGEKTVSCREGEASSHPAAMELSVLLFSHLLQWEIRVNSTHRDSAEGDSPFHGVETLIQT